MSTLKGTVTIQVCETVKDSNTGKKTAGKILQEVTKDNAVTEAFLANFLGTRMSTDPIGSVVRGQNNTATSGQFLQMINSGEWGVYCMDSTLPVNRLDVFPKYINELTTMGDKVVAWSGPGGSLMPNDPQCFYNRTNDGALINIEYTQTTGSIALQSVHIGRRHDSAPALIGMLLGEPQHQSTWVAGGTEFALRHLADRTIIHKMVGATAAQTSRPTMDLRNKLVGNDGLGNSGGSATAHALLPTRNNSGLIAGPGSTPVIRVLGGTHSSSLVNVVGRLLSPGSSFDHTIFEVNFTNNGLGTGRSTYLAPFLVNRPDNGTMEIFHINGISSSGALLSKRVINNPTVISASSINIGPVTEVATLNGPIPSNPNLVAAANNNACVMLTGYYDVDKQQYYFPCAYSVDGTAFLNNSNANICPGYIFDANTWTIVGEYIAYSPIVGGFLAPCMTEYGVSLVAVNTSTLYYPKVGQVISGVAFDTPIVKSPSQTLRIVYRYHLS